MSWLIVTEKSGAPVYNYDGSYAGIMLPYMTIFMPDQAHSTDTLIALGRDVGSFQANRLVGRYVHASQTDLAQHYPDAWSSFHVSGPEQAFDEQLPRADWSGNPETYHRPHEHMGGDLMPGHPWLKISPEERASLWSQGARPYPPYQIGPPSAVLHSPEQIQEITGNAMLAELLDTPVVTDQRPVTFFDPELMKYGNAISPFVTMPSYASAQNAMNLPLADRYGSRADQPNATDYLMMSLGGRYAVGAEGQAQAQGITYEGGDGMSFESAIVIRGARSEQDGIRAEYDYVESRWPGYSRNMQSLSQKGDRWFDVLDVTLATGERETFHFDITEYFMDGLRNALTAALTGTHVVGGDSAATKYYGPYAPETAQRILAKITGAGMTIGGNNPWQIDAHQHGIRFHAHYDPSKYVALTVTDKNFYVSYGAIWAKVDKLMPTPSPVVVGWSQPPHPIDVIPSFDPTASHAQQARDILYDYYHDDAVRSWVDDGNVKHAFGVKEKEDYDPTQLIEAYENPRHKVWSYRQGRNTWAEMNRAVKGAIARRTKLGPLPKSSYNTDPVVIYYYDNDWMKKITYPRTDLPDALHPDDKSWWKHGHIGTFQSADPKQIAAERAKPGGPDAQGHDQGGGKWGNEGFSWDKDVVGNVQAIVSVLMEVVGTVLQVIPGVGTSIGTALMIGGAIVASIAGAIDDAFSGRDNAGALAGIAKGLLAAATAGLKAESGIQIPPEALKALSGTVDMISVEVDKGQKKRLNYTEIWNGIVAQAQKYGKLGDKEAHAIAVVLGENTAGHVFIQGHTAGKLADPPTIAAIAKILEGMLTFGGDPKIINIFLLGAGLGHLTAHQQGLKRGVIRIKGEFEVSGDVTGQIILTNAQSAKDDLDAFVAWKLKPRYSLSTVAGDETAPSTQRIAHVQALLNELWGFAPGARNFIVIDGVLGPRTRELLRSFQLSYNVGPGDGTPTLDTIQALESEVIEKHAMQTRAAQLHATGQAQPFPPPPAPDWSALGHGCPTGMWWNPLGGACEPRTPLPSPHVGAGQPIIGTFPHPDTDGPFSWSPIYDTVRHSWAQDTPAQRLAYLHNQPEEERPPIREWLRAAKTELKAWLGEPPWYRMIGIGGDANGYVIRVSVTEITPEVMAIFPSNIGGVPVQVEAIGYEPFVPFEAVQGAWELDGELYEEA